MQARMERILTIAQDLHCICAGAVPKCSTGGKPSPSHVDLVPLELPPPPDITNQLVQLGLTFSLATDLCKAFQCAAAELKSVYEDRLHTTAVAVSDDRTSFRSVKLQATMRRLYEHQLKQWIRDVTITAQTRLDGAVSTGITKGKSTFNKKTPFNQEYIPLLETYFELNAYPSAADRAVLARKSMMTARQIEVWFQNHRNRAKKDGKELPRLRASDPLPLKLSLKSLEQQMCDHIVPESERINAVDSDVSEYETCYDSDEEDVSAWTSKHPRNPHAIDVLNVAAPKHAFPTTYPPSCDYDPFPVKHDKFAFPSPIWMRKPATSLAQCAFIDLNSFLDDFAKLSVREGPRRHSRKKIPRPPGLPIKPRRTLTPPPKPDRSAATHAITTIPSPAPHPAFLRTTMPVRVTPSSPALVLPTVHVPPSGLHASRSPIPQSQPATLTSPTRPASTVEKSAGRRKVAPLPRRMPNSTGVVHRGISPALSDSSPSPSNSHSPPSRMSSFSSDSSSQTQMSSGSSSTASSTLTTPLFSPTSLPETLHSSSPSVSISDFNFDTQSFADIVGGSTARALSPVEGLHLDFPSDATFGDVIVTKQPFNFNFDAHSAANFVNTYS